MSHRTPILALAPLLLACVLLAAACEDDDTPAVRTADTVTATADDSTSTAAPETATSADPRRTPNVTPRATREPEEPYGALVIDAGSGDTVTLYQDDDPWTLRDGYRPWLAAAGDGVWLSTTTNESQRYDMQGDVTETVEGWSVVESADGESRAYLVGGNDPYTIVVERGSDRYEVQSAGWNPMRAFSRDGMRFAWVDWSPRGESGRLMTLELEDGGTTVLVEDLDPCACDVPGYLVWSPSGEYLAYERRGIADHERGTAGVYILHVGRADDRDGDPRTATTTATATPTSTSTTQDGDEEREPPAETFVGGGTLAPNSWAETSEGERLVTLTEDRRLILTLADAGESVTLAEFPQNASLVVRADTIVVSLVGEGRAERSVGAFDSATGRQLIEYTGEADVVQTRDGVASAVITRTEIACTGLIIEHPDYSEKRECDVRQVRWSPDGRYLAMVPQHQGEIWILDAETGQERTVEIPRVAPDLAWSEDGRHLLLVWGGGL